MKRYFEGFYCRNKSDLELLNKSSNRRILDALMESYPSGMTAHQIEEKTQLPRQTIYSQLKELCRESFTLEIDNRGKTKPRGRPSTKTNEPLYSRHRDEVILEDSTKIFSYNSFFPLLPTRKSESPPAPGNVKFSVDFDFLWFHLAEKNEHEEINSVIMNFLKRIFRRAMESGIPTIKATIPVTDIEHCCHQCGVNHEARDFLRAILVRTIDVFEASKQFLDFMNENNFLTKKAYSRGESHLRDMEILEKHVGAQRNDNERKNQPEPYETKTFRIVTNGVRNEFGKINYLGLDKNRNLYSVIVDEKLTSPALSLNAVIEGIPSKVDGNSLIFSQEDSEIKVIQDDSIPRLIDCVTKIGDLGMNRHVSILVATVMETPTATRTGKFVSQATTIVGDDTGRIKLVGGSKSGEIASLEAGDFVKLFRPVLAPQQNELVVMIGNDSRLEVERQPRGRRLRN